MGDVRRAIVHVSLVVRDYDEAIEFYTQVLDFELLEDTYQAEQDKRWVVVAPRGSREATILLARASTPEQEAAIGHQTGGRVFLFLSTDDFWRDYKLLKTRDVRFVREPKTQRYGTVAVFEDLYGNQWDLLQLKSDHPIAIRAAGMRKQYFFRPSPRGVLAWDVDRLIALSRDLPRHQIPLTEIRELDQSVFGSDEPPTWRRLLDHVRLIDAADLQYPIILAADGTVMDGMHRIARAARQGLATIDAVRFDIDPPPDHVGKGPDDLPYPGGAA